MRIQDALPSSRFTSIVGSILLAGGVIYGAYLVTHLPPQKSAEVSIANQANVSADWKQALEDIQSQNPQNRLPAPPSHDSVTTLLAAATSDNVTDTVARTMFINLSNAKAQGLGDDIPTQDQIIADAAAKINAGNSAPSYVASDLSLSGSSKDSIKAYGNAFMQAISSHQTASYAMTLYIIGTSTDNADASKLAALKPIGADYTALARDLAGISVPPALAPLHLQAVNDIARIGKTFPDMQLIYSDPLRALAALQLFDGLNQELYRLFTNLAQQINQNGILFNKDEPGSAWSSLIPAQ